MHLQVNYFEPDQEEHRTAALVPYQELSNRICQGQFPLPDASLHPR